MLASSRARRVSSPNRRRHARARWTRRTAVRYEITGRTRGSGRASPPNPYQQEHTDLIASIRAGNAAQRTAAGGRQHADGDRRPRGGLHRQGDRRSSSSSRHRSASCRRSWSSGRSRCRRWRFRAAARRCSSHRGGMRDAPLSSLGGFLRLVQPSPSSLWQKSVDAHSNDPGPRTAVIAAAMFSAAQAQPAPRKSSTSPTRPASSTTSSRSACSCCPRSGRRTASTSSRPRTWHSSVPESLKTYDAVVFYTTGELPIGEAEKANLLAWIKSGKGFIGIHCATDTFYSGPNTAR